MTARQAILKAGNKVIADGDFESASIAVLCKAARVSNGSFFHAFPSKDALAAELFLAALADYHAAILAVLVRKPKAASGVRALLKAHMDWVVEERAQARFIFEQSRAEWMVHVAEAQKAENESFGRAFRLWGDARMADGTLIEMPGEIFYAQLIGPAQILCRAWLSGRTTEDPRRHLRLLADNAVRALVL